MTRETLDRHLRELLDEVLLLGSMVEQATLNSVRALRERSLDDAQKIYDGDKKINDKRFELEERTVMLIATQQPMAKDIRVLSAIFEIITELERMGDYAKGIGKITLNLGAENQIKAPPELLKMSEIVVDMLHQALEAFREVDEVAARRIPDMDDEVDNLFNQAQRNLFKEMQANPDSLEKINHLLWAAHNLERLADRVTNICERTIYVATGELLELDISDDESS